MEASLYSTKLTQYKMSLKYICLSKHPTLNNTEKSLSFKPLLKYVDFQNYDTYDTIHTISKLC